jgi:hypothetical protein
LIAEIIFAALGAGLVAGALCANQSWFDAHFLPAFFVSRRLYLLGETCARMTVAAFGLALALLFRRRLGRLVARTGPLALAAGMARVALALALAVGTSELALRATARRASEEAPPRSEPLCRHDTRLGWVFAPARVGRATVAGRAIDYAVDSRGYRVPSLGEPVDPGRPTILFTGESIMSGFGLRWDESIPAQVGAALKTQSANLSVVAYADDQSYMRLAAELPRFTSPTAVVILFSPDLFYRDFDDDRPHLGPELTWRPAIPRPRLEALLRFYVPYHSAKEIDRVITQTGAELAASVRLAHAYHAAALIVVPHFGPEYPSQRVLRQRILDARGLPYVWVNLDPSWRIPGDPHPNARAASIIGAAIATRLRQEANPTSAQ